MKTEIELSPKQCEYIKNATHRWNFKIGATQCGKTFIDVQYIIPMRLMERRNQQGLAVILGVTRETIERNVLEPMRDIWGENMISIINSRNIATVFGEKVYCLGSEKASQVAKIRGAKFKYLYIDEAVDMNEEVFQLIKSRLSLDYSCCDSTGNPSFPGHFIHKFINSDADVYCQTWTLYDNPFISGFYIESLENEYKGTVFFDRYILGRWALAQGRVYPFVMDDPARYTFFGNTQGQDGQFYVSIDYGTANPFSMGLWVVQNNRAIRLKEWYWDSRVEGSQKTDEEYYQKLKKFCKSFPVRRIIVDPSAASFIECIHRHREYMVWDAENGVINGIRVTGNLLQAGKILIHESCKMSFEEFGLYSWNDKFPEDVVIKKNDHAMDEIRYFAATVLAREYRWADWATAGGAT